MSAWATNMWPMRHFHLKVYFAHCEGSRFVSAEESVITFARMYEVNGVAIREGWGEITFDPFGKMTLHHPDPDENPSFRIPYEKFLSSLTEDDWLWGATPAHPIIPISSFEFIEGNWFDFQEKSPGDLEALETLNEAEATAA